MIVVSDTYHWLAWRSLITCLDIQSTTATAPCCLPDVLSAIEEELAALAIANDIQLILDHPTDPSITVTQHSRAENHIFPLALPLQPGKVRGR